MRIAAVTCLLAVGSASVRAQRVSESDLGSHIPVPMRARIPEKGAMPDVVRGRLVMAQFARCVTDRHYAGVSRAVASPSGLTFDGEVRRLATADCLDDGMMSFKPTAIRGPLFKELYVRRMEAKARGRTWGPVVSKIDLGDTGGTDDVARARAGTLAFGSCVAQRNETVARRIVLTPTASADQDAAIQAITPDLSACLAHGSQLRMGKAFIEAILAEVLYRGVEAPATVASVAAESK